MLPGSKSGDSVSGLKELTVVETAIFLKDELDFHKAAMLVENWGEDMAQMKKSGML